MTDLFSKPFALSIGPQACGGDILHSYFKRRRDVQIPKVKETFFFDRHIHRGVDFYQDHFDDNENVKLFMEITTTAFDHPRAPERVKELLGTDAKLFCPLRDPIERAAAVYRHYLRYGIVQGDIRSACEQAPQILFASRYADHLENWLEHFSKIHFISYETLQEKHSETLHTLCGFLGLSFVQPKTVFRFPKIFMPLRGTGDTKGLLPENDMLWLREQLGQEMSRLKALVGEF